MGLTKRERDVLRCAAAGSTTAQIMAELHISSATVERHIENARCKLNAFNRTHAVAIAIRNGEIN